MKFCWCLYSCMKCNSRKLISLPKLYVCFQSFTETFFLPHIHPEDPTKWNKIMRLKTWKGGENPLKLLGRTCMWKKTSDKTIGAIRQLFLVRIHSRGRPRHKFRLNLWLVSNKKFPTWFKLDVDNSPNTLTHLARSLSPSESVLKSRKNYFWLKKMI